MSELLNTQNPIHTFHQPTTLTFYFFTIFLIDIAWWFSPVFFCSCRPVMGKTLSSINILFYRFPNNQTELSFNPISRLPIHETKQSTNQHSGLVNYKTIYLDVTWAQIKLTLADLMSREYREKFTLKDSTLTKSISNISIIY